MDQVLEFLSERNRPFTVNDIVQGLNQQLGKSQVVSTLNKLVEQNHVIEKNCGKQKIYCVAQKSALPMKEVNANIFDMERKSSGLALKLKEIEDQLEKKSIELKEFEGKLTIEEILEKKQSLEDEIKDIQKQLEDFQGEKYDKKESEKIEKDYRHVLKEYNKRKRLCTDMIGAIFENYPKSKKHLLQEIGIETDEDVDFKVKLQIK